METLYRKASEQVQLFNETNYKPNRLRFELLFYEPIDEATRASAVTLLYQHPGDPRPLVSEAIFGVRPVRPAGPSDTVSDASIKQAGRPDQPFKFKPIDSRTRNNYYSILEVFRPRLEVYPANALLSDQLYADYKKCSWMLDLFLSGHKLDNDQIKGLTEQERSLYDECKDYLGGNKFTPEFSAALDEALRVFSESRPFDPLVMSALDVAKDVSARKRSPSIKLNVGYHDRKGKPKTLFD